MRRLTRKFLSEFPSPPVRYPFIILFACPTTSRARSFRDATSVQSSCRPQRTDGKFFLELAALPPRIYGTAKNRYSTKTELPEKSLCQFSLAAAGGSAMCLSTCCQCCLISVARGSEGTSWRVFLAHRFPSSNSKAKISRYLLLLLSHQRTRGYISHHHRRRCRQHHHQRRRRRRWW